MGERLSNITLPDSSRQKPRKRGFVKRVGAYAAELVFAFSPMLEKQASAQETSASQPSASYMVQGTRLQISNGKESPWVYAISRQADIIPTIKIKGPSVLKVNFYPAIERARFDIDPEVQSTLKYSISKEGEAAEVKTHEVSVKKSGFTSDVVDTKLAIASPVAKAIFIPKGQFIFEAQSPNGFLEVVSVEPVIEKVEKPKIEIPKPKIKVVKRKRVIPVKKEEQAHFNRFELSGERVWLHAIGPQENNGDMNQIHASVNIPIGQLFALNTGVALSSFGLAQESSLANTDLRSVDAMPMIGISLNKGKHTAFARGIAGYRLMHRKIDSMQGKGSEVEQTHSYALGGQIGYSYGHAIQAMISGSNNPFNPLSAKIHGSLPWGWVKGAHPSIEADVLWLHSLSAYEEAGRAGGVHLNVKNVFAHATAGVPIWKIGPVIPSLLVSGDLNASEKGFHHADFLVGASLSVELKRLMIEAGGAVSPLSKAPFFRLKVLYK